MDQSNKRQQGPLVTSHLRWTLAVCLLLLQSAYAGQFCYAQSSVQAIEGHVLHASLHSKIPGALVMAWPCGTTVMTDAKGAFQIRCSNGLDSLTVSCMGFKTQVVQLNGEHTDVWLEELQVAVGQALVVASRSLEMESKVMQRLPLLEALDATPGMQSFDLGGGMVQPVIRGLYGARVAVLEDGIPQQGGRWGMDHGILIAPELQVVQAWVPGGGHAWLGPNAMGGGLRFESPSLINTSGVVTRYGASVRAGNVKQDAYAMHMETIDNQHWHAGISIGRFGSTKVPQRSFSYIGRTYELELGELPNTAGHSVHAILGFGKRFQNNGIISLSIKASDIEQGLFPGIIGVPVQGDLSPNAEPFFVRTPAQHASRLTASLDWIGSMDSEGKNWSSKLASSMNERLEFAPPHAHGWGPLPDSELSLALREQTVFSEVRRNGPHISYGLQSEAQWVGSAGWEFLVPTHQRFRISTIVDKDLLIGNLAARFDLVNSSQDGFEQPLYNANGTQVGNDVRAIAFNQFVPGGMLSWLRPFQTANKPINGSLALALHGRVPSNHEWGANGIHHGTFRFEKGNPDLSTEWTIEGRINAQREPKELGLNWDVDAFFAVHQGFISLTPSATFAPISHAGQVYEFQANDAVRTGLEASVFYRDHWQTWSGSGSVLGQWDLRSGLGLPFTTPAQCRLGWEGRTHHGFSCGVSIRAIARTWLTARNEASTPGSVLADFTLRQTSVWGQCSLEVHNAFNTAWLDHISAYRALGLVAQGRWVQLSVQATLHHKKRNQK